MRSAVAGLETASRFLDGLIRNRFLRAAGIAGFLAFVLLGTATLAVDEGGVDYWQHLAAIRSLSSDLVSPPPLYFTEPYEVHLYTPFHLFWAAVRAGSVGDVWVLLVLMGAVNAALFVVGARLLARHLLRDPALDFAAILVFVTFWRRPVWWSGIYSLGQLPMQVTYPSFFALSLSMVVGALWMEERFRSGPWLLGFAVAVGLVFASHPVTASFLLLFLALKSLTLGGLDARKMLGSGAVLGGGLVLGSLWPLYSLPTLIGAAPASTEFFGDVDVFYRRVRNRVGGELIGFLALPLTRPPLRRFLAAMLAATLLVYVGNYHLDVSHVFSRYLIFATFTLHLAILGALAAARGRRWSAPVVAAVLVAAAAGGLNQLRIASTLSHGLAKDIREGVPAGTHAVRIKYRDLDRLADRADLRPGTVLAPLEWAYMVSALTDHKVVGVMHAAPTMPRFEERRGAVTAFYDGATPAETRAEILRRWKVDYVLVPDRSAEESPLPREAWTTLYEGEGFRLYEPAAP